MTKADIAAETPVRGGARAKPSLSQTRSPVPQATPALSQTITRVDLAEAVYRTVGLSRKESAQLVEMVIGEMVDCLAIGETVKLSSFGSFLVRDKGERVGRNPKTGVEVPIMQRRVLVFKPSNVLKAQMNGETVPEEDL